MLSTEPRHWHAFTALFCLTASVLILEISFSHIFSATLQHSMIFGVVGASILGLGLGGCLSYLISLKYPAIFDNDGFFVISGLVFALLILVLLYLATYFPWSWYQLIPMVVLPFVAGGVLLSSIYTRFTLKSHLLYYGDLSGASIGCLLSIVLLNGLSGPMNTILFTVGMVLFSTLLFAWRMNNRKVIGAVAILMLAALVIGLGNPSWSIMKMDYSRVGSSAHVKTYLADDEVIDSKWDAYSRVDLTKDIEGLDLTRLIHINGGTQATMIRFDNPETNVSYIKRYVTTLLNYFPFVAGSKEEALILGSGGGMEVLMALLAGTRHVTAVEINPQVVQMALDNSDYNGGIYRYRNVDTVVDEGRSFLKRSDKNYDLIYLPLTYSHASIKSGKLNFTEEYLYTIDAFRDYWEHLMPGGRLAIIINDGKLLFKLISTTLSFLKTEGLSTQEALTSIVALKGQEYTAYSHLLIIKKGGYLTTESMALSRLVKSKGFIPIHMPYNKTVISPLTMLAQGRMSLEEWIERSPFNISPATDESPFFFNREKGIPTDLYNFFLASLALFALFITGSCLLARREKRRSGEPSLFYFLIYFVVLGAGYMLVEISIAQRFILFLGYPTLSLSVVLFSFLLSSAIGSILSPYIFTGSLPNRAIVAAVSAVLLLGIYFFALTGILESTLSYSIGLKSLIAFLLIFPLGFFMGVPFPAGLLMLKGLYPKAVPWMWGVNGISSFMGALLVIIIAFNWGFHFSLLLSTLPYIVAAFIAFQLRTAMR